MAENSSSPSKEFQRKKSKTKSFKASIKDVFKFMTKWSSPKKIRSKSNLHKSQEALKHGKEVEAATQAEMNGMQEFLYNSSQRARNSTHDQTSPRGSGFFKHKSMDNYFTSSIPSFLSRSATKRSQTPTPRGQPRQPSPNFRTMNMKNTDGDDFLSKSASRRSTTPIMFSNSSGLIKPPAVEKKLECTLEEMCFGCVKKIKITRDVVTNSGQIVEEEEILTIKVKPGWKQGTKITFEGIGNERPGTYPADVTFLVSEKRHPLFEREGDDLELAVEIPLVKALTGCTLSVPILGGEKMTLNIDDIIYPGYVKKIAGQGMTVSKEEGRRGSLKIVFLVEFPLDLTEDQRVDAYEILQDSC